MGAFVYMAMIASDFIIVPIRAGSRFSLDGITKTINAINQIRRTKLNEGLVLLKFLYNMADLRRLADKHSLTILNNRYPGQVLTEYISEATVLQILQMLSKRCSNLHPAVKWRRNSAPSPVKSSPPSACKQEPLMTPGQTHPRDAASTN